jgi:hypothetical protein
MAISKVKRQLLIKARERIIWGKNDLICYALMDAARTQEEQHASHLLRSYISQQLGGGWMRLEIWQRENGYGNRDRHQVKQDRINWISWMLGELE